MVVVVRRLLLLGAIDGISGPSTVNVAYDRPRVCKLKCPPLVENRQCCRSHPAAMPLLDPPAWKKTGVIKTVYSS